ncbi:DUF4260 domain-containing protein [Aestuariivivens insulae]|uniref:DUF4260 domain-containing protein n=1 Tax=Aestuariivivens insulae TaxID=1621988 RepID=UPI001F57136F|nr:DUF4260 domain-containing protein [Aestuariivivens insulae]
MRLSLKIEELAMFLLGVFGFSQLDFSWWWFFALILAPDIGMLGYVVNSKVGAITYNLFHHKGIAIVIYFIGIYMQNQNAQLIGIMLFSHASLDRVFGYGLKYFTGFKHTHLGEIGK